VFCHLQKVWKINILGHFDHILQKPFINILTATCHEQKYFTFIGKI